MKVIVKLKLVNAISRNMLGQVYPGCPPQSQTHTGGSIPFGNHQKDPGKW
jgi:hypothetical protein